jgi:hypothetical protein
LRQYSNLKITGDGRVVNSAADRLETAKKAHPGTSGSEASRCRYTGRVDDEGGNQVMENKGIALI